MRVTDLCAGLGVDARDVVAFGDMPNDIPMLAWAGTSYAVANAHPSMLAVADRVYPSCEQTSSPGSSGIE